MIARIHPAPLRGSIAAIPSKSEAHRLLICAALADAPTKLIMHGSSQDIDATIRCLTALGAGIEVHDDHLLVTPISSVPASCEMDVGESGTTLRFMLCIVAALGVDTCFVMHGRLGSRPMQALEDALQSGGCKTDRSRENLLHIRGRLQPGAFALPGNVSSQYISGLLMALALLHSPSVLNIIGNTESADYIKMTLRAMQSFGVYPKQTNFGFEFNGEQTYLSPRTLAVDGDWSNAAFWLCANALPGCAVGVTGLCSDSAQGDRRIADIVGQFPSSIDASPIPDLIPTIVAMYAALGKPLQVVNAARLRLKESDRLHTVCQTIAALGGSCTEGSDSLVLECGHPLSGGRVDAAGDHRIAMMAAVAAIACRNTVEITGAEAVAKSYPDFWRDYVSLGGRIELI